MPLDFGGLVQGLTTGARGIQEGIAERKKLEQQALRQRLADELMKAQTQYYQHRAQQPTATHIDPLSKQGIDAAVGKAKALATVKPAKPGKPPSLQERKAAGEAQASKAAHGELTKIENMNPRALAEVARFVATPTIGKLVPGIGSGIEGVLRQARTAGLSNDAQTYIKRLYDFASLAGPSRYGRNFRSEVLLQQIWSDFGAGQIGVGAGGIGATQRNRENAIRIMEASGGEQAAQDVAPLFPQDPTTKTRKTYRPDNPFVNP
jgi:hypothetical protein